MRLTGITLSYTYVVVCSAVRNACQGHHRLLGLLHHRPLKCKKIYLAKVALIELLFLPVESVSLAIQLCMLVLLVIFYLLYLPVLLLFKRSTIYLATPINLYARYDARIVNLGQRIVNSGISN
jgi:hypothetical protein